MILLLVMMEQHQFIENSLFMTYLSVILSMLYGFTTLDNLIQHQPFKNITMKYECWSTNVMLPMLQAGSAITPFEAFWDAIRCHATFTTQ